MFSMLHYELARVISEDRIREADRHRLPGVLRDRAGGHAPPAPAGPLRRAAGRSLITIGSWMAGVVPPPSPTVARALPSHPAPGGSLAIEGAGRCEHCLW